MNFFSELKRRNVYKVGVAYIFAGWALSQGVAQVLPVFEVPNWVIRVIVLLIIIGLPIALLLAWMFELTPQGIKRTDMADAMADVSKQKKRVWIYVVAIGALLSIGLFFLGRYTALDTASPARTSNKSIAVLPFSDLSPNHDQESFSVGMAEEILNALVHIRGLKVVGRSSSFFYKGKNVSLKQIGSELGVANVLEGSVRKQGEQVRIISALTRAADGLQVWSKTYNGTLANIFDLQESFARDIAGELNVLLADPSEGRLVEKPTDNPQAYALFIEAQTLVSQRVGDSLPRAIALLKEATRLDPNFARAWAKLAVALAVEPQYAAADWQTNWAEAEPAARRAISLDSKSAEAYAALGYIDFSRRRYREMVEPGQRAIEIDPNDVTANFWLANQLAAMGRIAETETVVDRAIAADPANALVIFYKAMCRWDRSDKTTAIKLAKRTKALGGPLAGLVLGYSAAADGDPDSGAESFSEGFGAFKSGFSKEELAAIFRGSYGDETKRKAGLALIAAHPHDQFAGTLLLLLSEPEQSFASFERDGIGLSDAYYTFLWQPEAWSRKARQHPAFQDFAKRIGLVDYWKQNRWPDVCQPIPERGPDAFTCQ
ncbi:MAG TPA: tetratricopeptide repeat protein [Chthoniobacterales bacterium]